MDELYSCSTCGISKSIEFFKLIRRNQKRTKNCMNCLSVSRKLNKQYYCDHGRYKYRCRQCGVNVLPLPVVTLAT